MKIFNWMHRKLHPGVIKYSQVSHKKGSAAGIYVSGRDHEELEKREVLLEGLMEKEALLLHDVLNGAILAIGTLGRDDWLLPQFYSSEEDDGVLVMPAAEKEENNVLEEAEEEEELQVKEIVAQALMAATEPAAAATFVVVESVKFKAPPVGQEESEKKPPEMAMQADSAEEVERIQELPLLKEDREKRERGRTTLADLFAADHSFTAIDSSAEMNANKGGVNDRVKLKQHAAANYSEKKKTEKNKKEEKWTSDAIKASNNNGNSSSSNNRKLRKLVTKMLKKKVHPEIPGVQKTAAACNCKERD